MKRCRECGAEGEEICRSCEIAFLRTIIGTLRCPKCLTGCLDVDLRCTGCRRAWALVEQEEKPAGPEG